jgi:hypothetical protein
MGQDKIHPSASVIPWPFPDPAILIKSYIKSVFLFLHPCWEIKKFLLFR